jgi:DNA primase catalytic core
MARIPTEELERLKQEVALERLVEGAGVELKAHGADRIGRCPFHDDKTPSLVVSPNKNLWHCLGACQTGGTVIDWVMKAQGVSFRHAVEILQDNTPLAAAPGREHKVAQRSTTQKVASVLTREADDQALMRQVIDYYHETLKESPEALDYLEQRGLRAAGLIETFKLGFANRTLGYRLPAKNRKAGAELRGQLQKLGLIRSSGHEHFNGSLVIPVIDEHGLVTEVYGRKITPNLRKGTPLHMYLPGPHRGVFNVGALQASNEIILCESLIDALTFWAAGFRNVTSSYGTAGFTDDLLEAFKAHGIERVLIAYDRDEAGNAAATKLAEKLKGEGLDCFRILFPKGMDVNEYALKVQPAAKSLGLAIRKAEWMGVGKAPSVTTRSAAGAETADDEVADAISTTSDENDPSLVASAAVQPPTVASPLPSAPVSPADAVEADQRDRETVIVLGDRRYRVRGLAKNLSFDQLKVNLLVTRVDDPEASSRGDRDAAFYVDTLDLYSARHRGVYVKQAALELSVEERVIRHDLGHVLLKLEALQEKQIDAALKPEKAPVTLDDAEREAALELLRDPQLLDRILADFERSGIVGEETNKLVGYLACVSRKLERPLAVIIQSTSAAGKSALMDAVLKLMPDEETVHYSAMTGQSLFYMGETDLKHKILGVAEEAGVEEAAYALKLLQSQGELTIASTGKDPTSGKLVTQEYRVEGPVMLFLTTTAVEIDEELLNRCLVLSVNETREQTQAIHAAQRAQHTLQGLLAERESRDIVKLHRNAQRLIRPLLVANPYAEQLTFRDEQTRLRRDHLKYLTLIRAIALLHQYQRPLKTAEHNGQRIEYIEVTLDDIKIANRLAHEVLGRTLDELPPQTRNLLGQVHAMVAERAKKQGMARSDIRFTRRDVREHTGWGNTQLKVHLHRLEDMEYLLAHRGGRGQSFVYELLYHGEGDDGHAFVMGLIDPETLAHRYDSNRSGFAAKKSGPSRPQVGGWSGQPDRETDDASSACEEGGQNAEKHVVGPAVGNGSYRNDSPALVAASSRQ